MADWLPELDCVHQETIIKGPIVRDQWVEISVIFCCGQTEKVKAFQRGRKCPPNTLKLMYDSSWYC